MQCRCNAEKPTGIARHCTALLKKRLAMTLKKLINIVIISFGIAKLLK